MISIDDFKKVEVKVGEILSAEKIPETDKLLKLSVDFGMKKIVVEALGVGVQVTAPVEEKDIRQVISGISAYFPEPAALVGKKCAFITNLEPRKIKGFESQAMILAVGGDADPFSLFYPDQSIKPGLQAR